ncbi:MAG: hypothetical protein ACXVB9_10175 [Bdellovibrionota bacterium]
MILAALAFTVLSQAAAPTELHCTAGNGQPQIVVNAAGGHRLFVCALSSHKYKGHLELKGGFRVFMTGKNGKKRSKPVFQAELETAKNLVAKVGKELHVSELVWDGKESVPAFETVISCDAKSCKASSPAACVFQKPKPGSRRALEQIEDFQRGKKQGKVPEKKLIDALAALAYSGDTDAQAIFHDRGSLALDGSASDTYFDHQAAIERLKKAGCL